MLFEYSKNFFKDRFDRWVIFRVQKYERCVPKYSTWKKKFVFYTVIFGSFSQSYTVTFGIILLIYTVIFGKHMESAPHNIAVRVWSRPFSIDEIETKSGKKFKLVNLPFYYVGVIDKILKM